MDTDSTRNPKYREYAFIKSSRYERNTCIWKNTNLLFKYYSTGWRNQCKHLCATALIETGCDIQARNRDGRTLLHKALDYYVCICDAVALIKLGADVNAQDDEGQTPLFTASRNTESLEVVCMLLYYGADPNIVDMKGFMPIPREYVRDSESVCSILLNFCSKDKAVALLTCGASTPYLNEGVYAVLQKLIEGGASVNYVDETGRSILYHSIRNSDNSDLFKLVLAKTDRRILTGSYFSLLEHYVQLATFPPADWLQCLHLLLNWLDVQKLTPYQRSYADHSCGTNFVLFLLRRFKSERIGYKERINLIYKVLSLNVRISKQLIEIVYHEYGSNEELEAFIYCANFCNNNCRVFRWFNYDLVSPVTGFLLCTMNEDRIKEKVVEFLKSAATTSTYYTRDSPGVLVEQIMYLLRLFWLSPCEKNALHSLIIDDPQVRARIVEKLEMIPQIQSLLELSRNQTRVFIRQKFNVTKPYHFYDGVKTLNLPKQIVDIICFRQPLY